MNGFMSFTNNFVSYRSMSFPIVNNTYTDILAPFWADSDSTGIFCDCVTGCGTCGTGVVYYHVYKYIPNKYYPPNSTDLRVFDVATFDGKYYVPGFKKADWVMVVTWSNVIPFSYSYNKDSFEVSLNIT